MCIRVVNSRKYFCIASFNYTAPGECSEGEVRLADGDIKQEGRVEMCLDGVWGSVCGDGWNQTDAHTVCQQLDLGEGGQKRRPEIRLRFAGYKQIE